MIHKRLLMLIAGGLLALPAGASTILNTFPDGPAGYTDGFVLQAQTFTVPSDNVLFQFLWQEFNAVDGTQVQLEIYAWGANGPVGPALYTSPVLLRGNSTLSFEASSINLTLTTGNVYGAVIDGLGYDLESAAFNENRNSYTGGDMWLLQPNTTVWNEFTADNLYFQAAFLAGAPVNSSAPEPGAMMLVGVGLAALGVLGKKLRA
jgi:hypothetical protein